MVHNGILPFWAKMTHLARFRFFKSPGGKFGTRDLIFVLNALYWSPTQAWGVSHSRF